MSLAQGARLGAYQIESLRGAGGMGEVYRARDTRLDRTVAIKVLPAHGVGDAVRRQRFEREARAISQLNHPHICALYDVGEAPSSEVSAGGIDASGEAAATFPFLVMEFLEGQTLAERLKRGPLPVGEALQYGSQMADALDAAHRRGIVHRDLKPGNVMLTKAGAKLLDFGLARTPTRQLDSAMVTDMPSTLTGEGVILGTLPYMAPELLEGGDADVRSDMFAFGAVLYEMLTGRRAFVGNSESAVVAAILDSQPPGLQTGNAGIPPAVAHLVTTCLAKDPDERWQSAGDLKRQLGWIASSAREAVPAPEAAKTTRRGWWLWPAASVTMLMTGLGLSSLLSGDRPPTPARVSLHVSPPANVTFADATAALSPDGTSLAYSASSADGFGSHLWIHSLESGESRMLSAAGTVAVGAMVWSPDGRFVAFAADGKLKKIAVTGGSPQTLVDALGGVHAWSADDVLLFTNGDGVMRVPASGGTPVQLTAIDRGRHEFRHYRPRLLPDQRHFVYLRASLAEETSGIYIGSIDAKPDEQDLTRLVAARGTADYAPSAVDAEQGHLLFNRDGTLWAQRFDTGARQLIGDAFPVAERLAESGDPSRTGSFTTSLTGVLAYRAEEVTAGTPVWVSRDGTELMPIVDAPLPRPDQLRLSPDGSRLALVMDGNIWVHDLGGRPPIKLTTEGHVDQPLWSPDGLDIIYSRHQPPLQLLSVRVEAGSTPKSVSPLGHYHPHGWSPDGRHLITVLNSYSRTGWDILTIPRHGNGIPEPLVQTASADGMFGAALSPNGRWLAYTLNVTGAQEVWVRPYAGPGAPVRISANGGVDPHWARDGNELYFIENRNRLMAVAVRPGPTFDFTPPRRLFESEFAFGAVPNSSYDVAADGRFVMIRPAPPPPPTPITVVLNWASGLASR